MDTTALHIFVEVVKRGSFAAVARDRHVDPSIVSRAIKGLEDELGSRLFQRTTRRLSLTEAGVAFFDRIAPAVEKIERARESVAEAGRIPRGTLRVTTSVSFGERQLVPLLPKFRALHPELMIDLVLTETVTDLVAERFDVAIRLGQLSDSSLVAKRLFHTEYRVCASPEYLAGYAYLSSGRSLRRCDRVDRRTSWRIRLAASDSSRPRRVRSGGIQAGV